MKEIGEHLKQARETMGLTIEEVSEDLKLSPPQIQSIEEGDRQGLKDILNLKELVKDYAKYLGLAYEEIEDKFNEFVFEYTSKIPLDEIAKASHEKNKEKQQSKRVTSPYTKEQPKKLKVTKILLYIVLIMVLITFYFIIKEITYSDVNQTHNISVLRTKK